MLGVELSDPYGVEAGGTIAGMGLLPAKTIFEKEKTRTQIKGKFLNGISGMLSGLAGVELEGYEIHMGQTEILDDKGGQLAILEEISGQPAAEAVGMCRENIYGTYIHGIFDKEDVAKTLVSALYRAKGLDDSELSGMDVKAYKEQQYDLLAQGIRENIDMDLLYRILNEGV